MRRLPPLAIALGALGLAIAYALVTARLAGRLALPADDAYAYLTCATQRACAGSPSASWPALLAIPGAVVQGHGLVVVAFWIGALLYAITAATAFVLARRLGGALAGVLAAVATLAIAPLAWASLAGLEVALVTACWLAALALFDGRADADRPGAALTIVLIALGLAHRDAIVVVAAIALAGAWGTTSWRGLVAWFVPVLPALAWGVISQTRARDQMIDLEALRGDGAPLAYAFAVLWVIGAVRLVRRRSALALLVVLTPIAVLLVGGRAAAFPAFAVVVGSAASTLDLAPRARLAGALVAILTTTGLAVLPLRASLLQYAQDASDLDRRVAPFTPRFADATSIATHDPGAVGYYSGSRAIALDGSDPLEGPGARYERLERLAPGPSHFLSSPTALGFDVLFGEVRAVGRAGPRLAPRAWTRGEVHWIEADWDRATAGERPLAPHPGWRVVDRIDLADLADEAAHHWRAATSGKQATLLHRETAGPIVDGGRTITSDEQFVIESDPARPVRLILRTGGQRQYPDQPAVAGATLQLAGRSVTIPPPRGPLVELEIELPAGQREITVVTDRPYRAFHWFVLQPD
jgi:hypothetical protein